MCDLTLRMWRLFFSLEKVAFYSILGVWKKVPPILL